MSATLTEKAEKLASEATEFPAFSGFSLTRMKSDLAEALAHFGRLGIFEEYTKHDISHVESMLRVYNWIIPDNTADKMSPADWLLSTLSAYLHDFGLLVTRTEFENRDKTSAQFKTFKEEFLQANSTVRDMQQYLDLLSSERQEQFLYQEFVRKYHARRIKGWINGVPDPSLGSDPAVISRLHSLLEPLDSTFRNDLALVCESHHLDDLDDFKKYPVDRPYGDSPEETANVQYAAVVLRAADLLHITRDRSPAVAFEVINPLNPTSQIEWAKQNAVRRVRPQKGRDAEGNFKSDAPTETIEVFATFESAEGFFGLTSYLQYAVAQLEECYTWVKEANAKFDTHHKFPWRKIDSAGVEAKGFIASPFEFQIDRHKILDLLTGHTLYNDTNVALRELVQNSVDAVRLWQAQHASSTYEPSVHVTWDSNERILRVTDNGVGMSQNVIESNFLRAGSSRYQDTNFIKHNPFFSPISRFGIGVLSAFMIGDNIEVYTVSPDEEEARHLTLRSVHGKYLIRLLDKQSEEIPPEIRTHGTQIVLRIRKGADLEDIARTLRHWIVVPRCVVSVSVDGSAAVTIGFESVSDAVKAALVGGKIATVEDVNPKKLLGRRSENPVEIRVHESNGVTLAYAVEWDSWFSQWSLIPIRDDSRPPHPVLGTCIEGIRVTKSTPGFSGLRFYAIANATGKRAPKTNVARNSLEMTSELVEHAKSIYGAYVKHLSDEIKEMSTTRGLSVTKAVGEAGHLSRYIVGGYSGIDTGSVELEHHGVMTDVLKSVRAYLIERNGQREPVSLQELLTLDHVYTEESALSRHLEYVLSAVPRSLSKASILAAVSNDDTSSPTPMYCSRNDGDIFSILFLKYFEPADIAISAKDKSIIVSWQPTAKSQRWYNGSPDPLGAASDRRHVSELFIQASTDVKIAGAEEYMGARFKGATFLFEGHPLIEFARAYTSSLEVIFEFVTLLVRVAESRSGGSRSKLEEAESVLQYMRRISNIDKVTGKDLIDLVGSWRSNIFDISRWERNALKY